MQQQIDGLSVRVDEHQQAIDESRYRHAKTDRAVGALQDEVKIISDEIVGTRNDHKEINSKLMWVISISIIGVFALCIIAAYVIKIAEHFPHGG